MGGSAQVGGSAGRGSGLGFGPRAAATALLEPPSGASSEAGDVRARFLNPSGSGSGLAYVQLRPLDVPRLDVSAGAAGPYSCCSSGGGGGCIGGIVSGAWGEQAEPYSCAASEAGTLPGSGSPAPGARAQNARGPGPAQQGAAPSHQGLVGRRAGGPRHSSPPNVALLYSELAGGGGAADEESPGKPGLSNPGLDAGGPVGCRQPALQKAPFGSGPTEIDSGGTMAGIDAGELRFFNPSFDPDHSSETTPASRLHLSLLEALEAPAGSRAVELGYVNPMSDPDTPAGRRGLSLLEALEAPPGSGPIEIDTALLYGGEGSSAPCSAPASVPESPRMQPETSLGSGLGLNIGLVSSPDAALAQAANLGSPADVDQPRADMGMLNEARPAAAASGAPNAWASTAASPCAATREHEGASGTTSNADLPSEHMLSPSGQQLGRARDALGTAHPRRCARRCAGRPCRSLERAGSCSCGRAAGSATGQRLHSHARRGTYSRARAHPLRGPAGGARGCG